MQAIFASGVAMGRFAMGSNEPLGEPPSQDAIDLDTEGDGPAAPSVATDNKNRADASGSGKRKRAAFENKGGSMAALTEAVKGFASVVKDTIHAEGAPGIVKAVMGCSNFTKAQLMFCLDHLMEHKWSALGFLDMDDEEKDLWLTNHLTKNDLLY